MSRFAWLLLLAGCAGVSRDCSSCNAEHFGSDWIIVKKWWKSMSPAGTSGLCPASVSLLRVANRAFKGSRRKPPRRCVPLEDFEPGPGRYTFHGGDGFGHVYPEVLCTVRASSYAHACRKARVIYCDYPEFCVRKEKETR
jgi:hypothetical protein